MKRKLLTLLVVIIAIGMHQDVLSQCGPAIIGQNLVVNGDFSQGDVNFNTPLASWNSTTSGVPCNNPNPMTCSRNWSGPGEYWIHDDADDFNPGAFSSIPSPVSGGNMMLVDADCNPGGVVWEQTVSVTPGSNYYFSVWIASIHAQSPARLSFEVNGVILGTNVNAPNTTNTWVFYEDTWNSGALSGPVQLRILEQSGVGCTNGDDFAIDDINFIGGCQFGAAGPTPDLGPDQTLCGKGGSITLSAGVPASGPHYTYSWSTGLNGSGVSSVPNLVVTAPGTYSVCVSYNGSCTRSDVIVISDDYSINLGPDRTLCSPPTVTLNAGYTGPGVSYLWTYNGSPIPAASAQTYVANQAGTYTVQVSDPGCGIREDEIIITSSTITANNAQFCTVPSSVDLSVNGMGGTYNWYDGPAPGGTLVQANSTSYTTPPLSATTTYYVEDASSFSYTVGPASQLSGWGRSGNLSNHYLRFDATSAFVLDYVTVHAYNQWNSNFTVSIVLANSAGTVLATSPAVTVAGGTNTTPHRIPVGLSVPVGTNLRMYAITSGGQIHYDGNSHPTSNWPYQVAGVVNIHTNVSDGNIVQNSYNHLYNWEISSGAICDRVPVTAVQFCPPSCVPPSAAQISNPSPVVLCTGGTVILNANHEPGYEYTWVRNGVAVAGPTVNLFDYTANTVGTYSVRITETGSPFCFLQSATVDVVEFNVGAVDLIPDYATCNPSQTLDAIVSGTGVTYIWERNAAVIPGATSRTYTISDLGAYRVWVTHPVCGAASDVVVVSAGTYSINLGSDRNLCTPAFYNLDAGFTASGVTYQWQSPVGTSIPGANARTYYVNAPGTYRVVVTHPFCGTQSDDINITSSLGSPSNGDFCSDDPSNNTATLSMTGTGPFEWYDDPTGGTLLNTGGTYTTPPLTAPATYYVKNASSFKISKGPLNVDAPMDPAVSATQTYRTQGGQQGYTNTTDQYLQFTALKDMTFDSVTVYLMYPGYTSTVNLSIDVRNVTSGTPGVSISGSPVNYSFNNVGVYDCGGGCNNTNMSYPVQIPLGGLNLVAGQTYRIYNSGGFQIMRTQPGSGPVIPMNSTVFDEAGIIDFNGIGNIWGCNCQYPGFFNMIFSAGMDCDRIPVQAMDIGPCIVTPVSWLDFTATSRTSDVLLEWATASENNNNFFIVQRSVDGLNWESIGQVPGNNHSNVIRYYSFTDQEPPGGLVYYRIVQQDFDGTQESSEVKNVRRNSVGTVSILPNPFTSTTNVLISGDADEFIALEIVDVNGKTLYVRNGELANQVIEVGRDLGSGLYFLKITSGQEQKTYKIIKEQ